MTTTECTIEGKKRRGKKRREIEGERERERERLRAGTGKKKSRVKAERRDELKEEDRKKANDW